MEDRDITDGRIKGNATRGRKRMHLLRDLMKNRSYTEVKREAQHRPGWRLKCHKPAGNSRRQERDRNGLGHVECRDDSD